MRVFNSIGTTVKRHRKSNGYDKLRHTWDIDPVTKIHNTKKNDKSFQRRRTRQNLNNFHGHINKEDLDDSEFENN
jgi:hypothetical protein